MSEKLDRGELSERIDWLTKKWSDQLGPDIAAWGYRTREEIIGYLGELLAQRDAAIKVKDEALREADIVFCLSGVGDDYGIRSQIRAALAQAKGEP